MGSLPSPHDLSTTFNPMDLTELSTESRLVTDFITQYYQTLETRPVQPLVKPGFLTSQLPEDAPFYGESMEEILSDVNEKIVPGLTHWQSPNFHAYFPASSSNAGLMGELLCSGLSVIGFTWSSSPAATELENVVVDWMAKMLNLPPCFQFSGGGGGVLHSNTCEAVLCTLAAARDKTMERVGDDKINKLVVYCSDQTHFTIHKGAKLIGIRPKNIKSLTTRRENEYGLCPNDLRNAIEADMKAGLVPFYLCGTIGTTALGAVDPIKELGKVVREYDLWFHVDGAYAGSACICPEFQHYLDGIELADSISMNAHKWLLSNLDCCFMWLRSPKTLIQSLAAEGTFLKGGSEMMVDYKDWQISLSRRFRAIKMWVVIRRYGVSNLIEHIRSDVSMAARFEEMVRAASDRFEIVFPRKFSLVCFKLRSNKKMVNGRKFNDDEYEGVKPSRDSELTRELMEKVNSSGKAYLSGVQMGRIFFIRCVIGSSLTEERHVDNLWKIIQETARSIMP
uniref:Tyrosine decarboxylase n=1 Tax=Rhodiola sachalinensis TaxID=265354 RepID=Q1KLR8_RHOSK|nr:tyrosine decarboxylase [Rhodiola sachalinensis]